MSAYVSSIKPVLNSSGKLAGHSVSYSDRPELRFMPRHAAEAHCAGLREMYVRVESHECAFEVEELGSGGFAIVCRSHPPAPTQQIAT